MPGMACTGREHRKPKMNRKNRGLLCVFKELYLWKWRPTLCMCVGVSLSGFTSAVGCMSEPTSDSNVYECLLGSQVQMCFETVFTPRWPVARSHPAGRAASLPRRCRPEKSSKRIWQQNQPATSTFMKVFVTLRLGARPFLWYFVAGSCIVHSSVV